MTSGDIDPIAFKDWEDAFAHPIAATRGFEKTLRSHAEENGQKLRTIVGASYRDLLGTADRIIEMDTQIRRVDVNLGLLGQKSNSKAVERIFQNYARFDAEMDQRKRPDYALASQMIVLQRCSSVLSRLIKRKGSPLLAAKVLVLSRLTHKVLSQTEPDSRLLKSLQGRLASQRQRLLGVIDERLADPDTDVKVLVDHMCAYSLTTSATPTDILRHFYARRLQAIEACLMEGNQKDTFPTRAVRILVQSAQITPTIFPKKLSDALAKLKEVPLLQQKDVASLAELELDIHGRWIAEELRNYTPWPRHDELQKPEADKQLRSWTIQAVKTFIEGLKKSLTIKNDFGDVISTRKDIFTSWPWSNRALPGLDSEEVVDKLREILNARLTSIIIQTTGRLQALFSDAQKEVVANGNKVPQSIWKSSLISADALNGAINFKHEVQNAYFGEDMFSSSILRSYDLWIEEVTSLMAALKSMKEDHWDIDLDEADDDFDFDSRRASLSEDDARELEDVLSEQLLSSLTLMKSSLKILVDNSVGPSESVDASRCICVLRVVREISQRPVGEGYGRRLQNTPQFGSDIVLPLQERLAQLASGAVLAELESRLKRFAKSPRLTARLLWEGSPSLPMQPSPVAFRFLRDLTKSMSAYGCDIWPVGTVQLLRIKVQEKILPLLANTAKDVAAQHSMSIPKTNGSNVEETDDSEAGIAQECPSGSDHGNDLTTSDGLETLAKDKIVQLVLDALYFLQALCSHIDSEEVARDLIESASSLAVLEHADVARLQKNAGEYWKRTYLMNALLIA